MNPTHTLESVCVQPSSGEVWLRVFLGAVAAGGTHQQCINEADLTVQAYQERFCGEPVGRFKLTPGVPDVKWEPTRVEVKQCSVCNDSSLDVVSEGVRIKCKCKRGSVEPTVDKAVAAWNKIA